MGMLKSFRIAEVLYLQFFSMICLFVTETSSFQRAKPQKPYFPHNQHSLEMVSSYKEQATRIIYCNYYYYYYLVLLPILASYG